MRDVSRTPYDLPLDDIATAPNIDHASDTPSAQSTDHEDEEFSSPRGSIPPIAPFDVSSSYLLNFLS